MGRQDPLLPLLCPPPDCIVASTLRCRACDSFAAAMWRRAAGEVRRILAPAPPAGRLMCRPKVRNSTLRLASDGVLGVDGGVGAMGGARAAIRDTRWAGGGTEDVEMGFPLAAEVAGSGTAPVVAASLGRGGCVSSGGGGEVSESMCDQPRASSAVGSKTMVGCVAAG